MSYIDEKRAEYEMANKPLLNEDLEKRIFEYIFSMIKSKIDFAIQEGKTSISVGTYCDDYWRPKFSECIKYDYMNGGWTGFQKLSIFVHNDSIIEKQIDQRESSLSISHIKSMLETQVRDLGAKNIDITFCKISTRTQQYEKTGLFGKKYYKTEEVTVSPEYAWRLYIAVSW